MSPRTAPGAAARATAAQVVDAVLQGRSLRGELAPALSRFADPRDRALIEAMVLAVMRAPARPMAALDAWMARPLPRREATLRALLLVALVQIDPLGLPAHAAVAATVDAARLIGAPHHAKLVNALLRRALREPMPAAALDAHWPAWLREAIAEDWPDDTAAIVEASTSAPPMWLRVNGLRGSRDAYLDRLKAAGIEARADADTRDAIALPTPVPVALLPGFDAGDVSVQDASAQAVVDALGLERGARVLDACAAPGGKAAHVLERDPSAQVTAVDIDALRLKRVDDTLARLHLRDRADLVAADALHRDAWWDGRPFDAVLLDAPCSATGIVRRQPDVVMHRRRSDIDALIALQGRMLDALWLTLAPRGVFVYATCSILAVENARQVEAFLARTPDAHAEALDERFGRVAGVGRQVLPGERGRDGFFYTRLRKH